MEPAQAVRIAHPPEQPLLVYDGECGFCRQWVERWRGMTGERVQYRPAQDVAGSYPEIGADGFRQSVWLLEPGGHACRGAQAVFRLYALAGAMEWPEALYHSSPTFAGVSESVYRFVAHHRDAAARVVRWFWGDITIQPSYVRMRVIFLRGLGLVYLAAFWSLAVQLDGLIGSRGILPAAELLESLRPPPGVWPYTRIPTVFWLDASDRSLQAACWAGVALSGLLVVGVLPRVCLVLLWVLYLSFTVVGQEFLRFQWDALLLETGVLGILLAPWSLRIWRASDEPSRIVVWLIRWLIFRVMFLSGVVKLASGDAAWRAWEALKYHYETQPLPTWTSWYIHQAPPWFHKLSVGYMFWAELIVPFFVFGPRRVRMLGCWNIVLLQLLIALTGNYGFFNVLTALLCVALVEDRDWGRKEPPRRPEGGAGAFRTALLLAAAAVIVTVTTAEGIERVNPWAEFPRPVEALRGLLAPYESLNSYGLFAVMTTERREIIVEGSDDGVEWKPYQFRWKPQEVDRRPRFTTPHMPRLDWQMWFAALVPNCRYQPWFISFEQRLLEGSPTVLRLLRENPFPDHPPRRVRARLFLYHFTHRGQAGWWEREELRLYCPPVRL